MNNNKLITINFKYKEEKWKNFINLSFRDSNQLLPKNLRDLANCFEVETKKSFFPFDFVNNLFNKLNYKGNVPDYKYFKFDDITQDQYNLYVKDFLDKNKN